MAQALENVNVSQNLGKSFLLHKKMVIIFQNCFWRNPVFSKAFDQLNNATLYHITTSPCAKKPNNILLLLQAPAVRAARSAQLPRSGGTGKRE